MALPWLESVPVWGADPAPPGRPRPARSGSPRCSWAAASSARTWWAKGSGPSMELGRCLEPSGTAEGQDQRRRGPLQQAGDRRGHPPRPDRQHPLGRGAPEGGRAEGRDQRRPGARPASRRPDTCSRAWSWAASSRSPATTRPTSRWRTARTSPGRARPRRCRWRSTRRWRSTACSRTGGASGTGASSTGSARRPPASGRRGRRHGDRAKLDEYLTSVREVEKRAARDASREGGGRRAWQAIGAEPAMTMPRPANGLPEDIREHMRLMCDLDRASASRRTRPASPRSCSAATSPASSTRSSASARHTTGPRTTTRARVV